jgi:hypothetical protein
MLLAAPLSAEPVLERCAVTGTGAALVRGCREAAELCQQRIALQQGRSTECGPGFGHAGEALARFLRQHAENRVLEVAGAV